MDKYNPHIEKELFRLIAEGNENAFKEFYLLVLPNAMSYVLRMLKSKEATKEVMQEALMRFWLHRDKLPEIERPKAWLFRIIVNECYRYLRAKAKTEELFLEGQDLSEDTYAKQSADLDLAYKETQKIILETIAGLSPRQRTVYLMSREEGLTLPEIAARLGLERDYVKKVLIRALHIIRQRLIETGRWLPVLIWELQNYFF